MRGGAVTLAAQTFLPIQALIVNTHPPMERMAHPNGMTATMGSWGSNVNGCRGTSSGPVPVPGRRIGRAEWL